MADSSAEINESRKRPKVALVLSGGGALGFAHIGVLKALEELQVPVDCIAGTSMGALVGGSYAAGVSPVVMEKVINETDIAALFEDSPPRSDISQHIKRDDYRPLFDFTLGFNEYQIQLPSGASAGYKFELFLKEMVGKEIAIPDLNFDYLPVPFRAVATDLESGEMKVFNRGELARVMRASMSLPAVVAPAEIGGRMYIDGGIVRNLPVDIARDLCGEIIIAVNLGTRPKTREQIHNSIDVAQQSVVILTEQNVKDSLSQLSASDILIVPDLSSYDASSFSNQREIIKLGEQSVRQQKEALLKFAVTAEEYKNWQTTRQYKKSYTLTITGIKAQTSGYVGEKAVLRDISTKLEGEFDLEKLHQEIIDIYGRGDFSYVGYSIIPEEDNATLQIKADSKPWGPGYLKLGLGGATDFDSPTQLNLAAGYRRTWVDSLGAEFRADAQLGYDALLRTEFMQPLQVRDGAFVAPYLGVRRYFVQFYEEDIRLGEFKVNRYDAGVNLGIGGKLGEITAGPYISKIKGKPDFSFLTSLIPEEDLTQRGILIKLMYDQLDRVIFPRSGISVSSHVMTGHQAGSSSDSFTIATAGITGAKSFSNSTITAHVEGGNEITGLDDIPVYEAFTLGGPHRLTGLYLDQLKGSNYDLETLDYYYRYTSLPSQLGRGVYLGFTLQSGRINDAFLKEPYERINSTGVYLAADTILGALYLGYGYSSLDQESWYLVIGPRF